MTSHNFRAFAGALFLGAGVFALSSAAVVSPASAAARPAVGKLLQQAIDAAKGGSTSAAEAKLRQAEGVGGLTPGDQQAIDQVKTFIEAKSGSGATGSKAKFAQDYNAGHYAAVVGPDAAELRKAGQYDAQSQLVVAQAYYQMGNYPDAIRMLKGMGGDTAASLLMAAAAKSGDTATEQQAAEKLILSGQSKYWTYELAAADATHGLNDHATLDVARVRLLTGNMRNADDYQLAAEISLELGLAAEAQSIVQKGMDAKVLTDARSQRLAATAQAQAAKDQATLAATTAQANAAKNGDLLVKLGEKLNGMGKAPDAVNAIKSGIAKGVTDQNDAQIRLGQAEFAAGDKDGAVKAFAAVKGDPRQTMVAHLWSLYVRTGGAPAAPAAPAGGTSPAAPPSHGHHHH